MAEELTNEEVMFKGDSLVLINQVLQTDNTPDWLIEGEVDTMRLFLQDHVNWKIHCKGHLGKKTNWRMD